MKLIKQILPVFFSFVILIANTHAMKSSLDDHTSFYREVRQEFQKHHKLFDSSKNKDIVIFLGTTGSGKSTSLNFLNQIPLKTNDDEDLVLDTHDAHQEAFAIGTSGASETSIPQMIFNQETGVVMYDVPGFGDNRGATKNLLAAGFIKDIIEKAKSCKIVFVMEETAVTTKRGDLFKQNIEDAVKLFGTQDLIDISLIIISKAKKESPEAELAFLKRKLPAPTALPFTKGFWGLAHEKNIFPFKLGEVLEGQRIAIIEAIKFLESRPIPTVDIEAIYDHKTQQSLEDILYLECDAIFRNEFSSNNLKINSISDLPSLEKLRTRVQQFQQKILEEIQQSPLLNLLKPLASDAHANALKKNDEQVDKKVKTILSDIKSRELEIKEQISIEKERKLAAEKKAAEEQAEKERARARQLQEEAERQKAKAKAAQEEAERERRRQQEIRYVPVYSGFSGDYSFSGYSGASSSSSTNTSSYKAAASSHKADYQDSNGRWHAGSSHDGYKAGQFISKDKVRK